MQQTPAIISTLDWFQAQNMLTPRERKLVESLFSPCFEFAPAMRAADSIHVHIRVDDTDELPQIAFQQQGGTLDNAQPGYVKYRFPDGLNMIFSHIPIAQDNLAETAENRRPRPYVDHLGIDLRREDAVTKNAFDEVPPAADTLGWGHIPQGGKGRPVYCCHIEVGAKHWIYPPDSPKSGGLPLEFALGPLKTNGTKAGCDLRPSSPVVHLASAAKDQCCP
jgi:hypothetical protein